MDPTALTANVLDLKLHQILNNDLLASTLNKVRDQSVNLQLSPSADKIFRAFELITWDNLSVVIIGQDPYPDNREATGLAFSVPDDIKIPNTLLNVYKCLVNRGLMVKIPEHGNLTEWAEQGVLLLNTSLTTIHNTRASHMSIWENYINKVIKDLCVEAIAANKPLVFMHWGGYAQKKINIIRSVNAPGSKIHVLLWNHPSPASTSNNSTTDPKHFIHCDNFDSANEILESYGKDPIDWNIY